MRPHGVEDLATLGEHGIDGPRADPYIAIDPIDELGPTIWFNQVPEPKRVRTAYTWTYTGTTTSYSGTAQRSSTGEKRGQSWPIPKATSSASFSNDESAGILIVALPIGRRRRQLR